VDLSDLSRWLRGSALEAVLLVLGTILVVRGLRTLLRWATPRLPSTPNGILPEGQRYRRAVLQAVERSFVGLLWFVTTILVLNRLGVPIATLVAPATVLGAAIGFGAQRVVADFLSGFFLITERQYGFGDVVQIGPPGTTGGVTGTVEEVSLRFTRLRTPDGETLMLPNSEIRQVVNRSKVAGDVVVDVPLPTEVELDPFIASLEASLQELAEDDEWSDVLLADPVVAGVQSVDLDRVDLRLSARVSPTDRVKVARELRRRGAIVTSAAVNERPPNMVLDTRRQRAAR
jgi:small conductance mechanosensitive channel